MKIFSKQNQITDYRDHPALKSYNEERSKIESIIAEASGEKNSLQSNLNSLRIQLHETQYTEEASRNHPELGKYLEKPNASVSEIKNQIADFEKRIEAVEAKLFAATKAKEVLESKAVGIKKAVKQEVAATLHQSSKEAVKKLREKLKECSEINEELRRIHNKSAEVFPFSYGSDRQSKSYCIPGNAGIPQLWFPELRQAPVDTQGNKLADTRLSRWLDEVDAFLKDGE